MNSKEYVMPDGKKAVFEYDHNGIGKVTIEAMNMLMRLIADGRKRGEWIALDDTSNGYWKCSVCGTPTEAFGAKELYKFCPFCGADMKGADDE